MFRRSFIPLLVVTVMIASVMLPVSMYSNVNGGGEGSSFSTMSVNGYTDFSGYKPISSADDLCKIGNDANYPLDGEYYLTTDIDMTGNDNGGVMIGISAYVSGSTLKVTLDVDPNSTAKIDKLYAWIGNSYNASADPNFEITTLTGIPSGTGETLVVGGKMNDGEGFAYSVKIDTTSNGEKTPGVTFDSNGNFDPIGEYIPYSDHSKAFSGTFDGNGFKISKMEVAVFADSSGAFAGLFGHTYKAKIKNLNIVDGYSVSITALGGKKAYAGGIAGLASESSVITNCYNNSKVASAYASASAAEGTRAGGIVGESEMASIDGCHNAGSVSSNSQPSSSSAGGIAGSSWSIMNCSNSGDVTSYGSENTYAGGITASGCRTTASCYNKGTVFSSSDKTEYAGGIAGSFSNSVVKNCYNEGNVTVKGSMMSSSAGGIVGQLHGSIEDCYNIGRMNTSSASTYLGGIAGYVGDNASITHSYFLEDGRQKLTGFNYSPNDDSGSRSVSDMKKKNNYTEWDFSDDSKSWSINKNVNQGYPTLNAFDYPNTGSNDDNLLGDPVVVITIISVVVVAAIVLLYLLKLRKPGRPD